jgi:peroxiredoxin Q/BCP
MLEAGAKLPDVGADDDAATPVALSDLGGKKQTLVVYFYPKADTPGCTNETIQFRDLYAQFEKKGATVVGVSRDAVKAQAKFKEKYDVPFALLADVESKICDAFGVIVEKNMYGKKSLGIQRSTFVVKDGVIAKVWPKVSVEGHAAEVLASL